MPSHTFAIAASLSLTAAVASSLIFAEPPAQPAQATPAAETAAAAGTAAIKRARDAYAAITSYADRTQIEYTYHPTGHSASDWTASLKTHFVAPSSISVISETEGIITNGEELYKLLMDERRYTREPMPSEYESSIYARDLPSGGLTLGPIVAILLRQNNPDNLLRIIQEVTHAESGERDGTRGLLVRASGSLDPDGTVDAPVTLEMFFRDEDGLLTYLSLDATEGYNQGPRPEWERVAWSYNISDIETSIDIPAKTFAPPDTFKETDDLRPQPRAAASRSSQMLLIGQPAPAIEGKDHLGDPLSLADFEGQVVVLDFWAMWCAPCVAALPHVQSLHERFEGKPVAILGINLDRTDPTRVAAFAEERGITFRHYMDDGAVGEAYKVRGIPAMVIIDKNGIIQDVSSGFPAGKQDIVASQIEKLLEGKNLRTEEELADIRRRLEEEQNRPRLAYSSQDEERLEMSPFRNARSHYSRHMSMVMDVDGKPGMEVIAPGNEGDFEILDSAGESVRRITLQGVGRNRIGDLAPVFIDGKRHWIVAISGRTETLIGFYSDTGRELWTYHPEFLPGTFVQAMVASGDLTGDGQPEIVVGMSATGYGEDSRLDFSEENRAGALIVLSRDGERLAQRATDAIDFLFVGQPTKSGVRAPILYSVRGRLARMHYTPGDLEAATP